MLIDSGSTRMLIFVYLFVCLFLLFLLGGGGGGGHLLGWVTSKKKSVLTVGGGGASLWLGRRERPLPLLGIWRNWYVFLFEQQRYMCTSILIALAIQNECNMVDDEYVLVICYSFSDPNYFYGRDAFTTTQECQTER